MLLRRDLGGDHPLQENRLVIEVVPQIDKFLLRNRTGCHDSYFLFPSNKKERQTGRQTQVEREREIVFKSTRLNVAIFSLDH